MEKLQFNVILLGTASIFYWWILRTRWEDECTIFYLVFQVSSSCYSSDWSILLCSIRLMSKTSKWNKIHSIFARKGHSVSDVYDLVGNFRRSLKTSCLIVHIKEWNKWNKNERAKQNTRMRLMEQLCKWTCPATLKKDQIKWNEKTVIEEEKSPVIYW